MFVHVQGKNPIKRLNDKHGNIHTQINFNVLIYKYFHIFSIMYFDKIIFKFFRFSKCRFSVCESSEKMADEKCKHAASAIS